MKSTRLPIAAMCLVLVGAATHTEAKPKPVPAPAPPCRHLVNDPSGDANGINVGAPVPAENAGPSNDALDILNVDLGTSPRNLVWLLTVKKLALTSPLTPTGMYWFVRFNIRSTTFEAVARVDAAGAVTYYVSYRSPSAGGTLGPVPGYADTQKGLFRWTVPWALLAQQEAGPSRATLTHIDAVAGQQFVVPDLPGGGGTHAGAYNAVDWTTDDATYTPGKRPRCG